jgi:hypothetical protein
MNVILSFQAMNAIIYIVDHKVSETPVVQTGYQ